jgi:hypothetical protein
VWGSCVPSSEVHSANLAALQPPDVRVLWCACRRGAVPGDYSELMASSEFCLVLPGDGESSGCCATATAAILVAVDTSGERAQMNTHPGPSLLPS